MRELDIIQKFVPERLRIFCDTHHIAIRPIIYDFGYPHGFWFHNEKYKKKGQNPQVRFSLPEVMLKPDEVIDDLKRRFGNDET